MIIMKDRIKAIENYLLYFPNDIYAKSNLLLCKYSEEIGLEITDSYYPRIEYNQLKINDQIIACKKYYLTNSATKYEQNGEDTIIVWREPCGRLSFVLDKYYSDIDEEWEWFIEKIKSYNPLDYDEYNDSYIYNVENGKKLINDYKNITNELHEKIKLKSDKIKLENKRLEFEKLKKELEVEL